MSNNPYFNNFTNNSTNWGPYNDWHRRYFILQNYFAMSQQNYLQNMYTVMPHIPVENDNRYKNEEEKEIIKENDIKCEENLKKNSENSNKNVENDKKFIENKKKPKEIEKKPIEIEKKPIENNKIPTEIVQKPIETNKDSKELSQSVESVEKQIKKFRELKKKNVETVNTKRIIKKRCKKYRKKKKKYIRKRKTIRDLALRNIRSNFAANITKFVKFLIELSYCKKEKTEKIDEYKSLYYWLVENGKRMNSYENWRKMWGEEQFGRKFRKICKSYFQRSFALTYIETSRIKKEYKKYYYNSIEDFGKAVLQPELFVANNN